jgi:hypothetical protein
MRRKWFGLPILVLVACCCLRQTAGADFLNDPATPSAATVPVSERFFGLHVRWFTTTPWPNTAFGTWRVITNETTWYGLEPRRGQWRFEALDAAIALAEKHGVQVILTLGNPPAWASARPHDDDVGRGLLSQPAQVADWRRYVQTLAQRYRGRIHYYELWNEPKFRDVEKRIGRSVPFGGSSMDMVQLAQTTRDILTAEDPKAKLISPSFDGEESGIERLRAFLKAGGGSYVDVVGFHFYVVKPERIAQLASKVYAVMKEYGAGGKELWNTESGVLVEDAAAPKRGAGEGVFATVLGQKEAAAFLARAQLFAAASGVARFLWYSWDIPGMGLTSGRGKELNEVGRAFAMTHEWLMGRSVRSCVAETEETWRCTLSESDEIVGYVLWNSDGQARWPIPEGSQVRRVQSLDGALLPVDQLQRTRALTIGPTPVLVSVTKQSAGAIPRRSAHWPYPRLAWARGD